MIRNSRVCQDNKALIARHWEEISRALTPPGVVCEWSGSGLSHKLKCRLRESRLIRRSPGGGRWETTERLWLYVISVAGDTETIGRDASGQQVFAGVPLRGYEGSINGSEGCATIKMQSSTSTDIVPSGIGVASKETEHTADGRWRVPLDSHYAGQQVDGPTVSDLQGNQ
jgi:hypothetical protein